jgi:hypothetical protein
MSSDQKEYAKRPECERCNNVGCSFGCMKEQRDEIRKQYDTRVEALQQSLMDEIIRADAAESTSIKLKGFHSDLANKYAKLEAVLMQIAIMTTTDGESRSRQRDTMVEIAREALRR